MTQRVVRPRLRAALVVSAGLALTVVVWVARAMFAPSGARVRLATGSAGGTSYEIGKLLARTWKAQLPDVSVTVLQTAGGQRNVPLVEKRAAELALVHSDLVGGHDLRMLATLYQETLQIVTVVPPGAIGGAEPAPFGRAALAGKRLAIGPRGSGTNKIVRSLLRQFEIIAPSMASTATAPIGRSG